MNLALITSLVQWQSSTEENLMLRPCFLCTREPCARGTAALLGIAIKRFREWQVLLRKMLPAHHPVHSNISALK